MFRKPIKQAATHPSVIDTAAPSRCSNGTLQMAGYLHRSKPCTSGAGLLQPCPVTPHAKTIVMLPFTSAFQLGVDQKFVICCVGVAICFRGLRRVLLPTRAMVALFAPYVQSS
jgi:hypothetical protein